MAGGKWPQANRDTPCPNCGHKRRCHLRADGGAVRCYWPEAGQRWGYLQETGEDSTGAFEVRFAAAPTRPNGVVTPKEDPVRPHAATAAQIAQVYSDLIDACPPSAEHIAHLESERGLTDEQIRNGRFGSLPGRSGRAQIVEGLLQKYGRELLDLVPGFRSGKTGMLELVAVGTGILIPYLRGGVIVGLRLRLDRPGNGGRYRWLSGGGSPSISPSVYEVEPTRNGDAAEAVLVEGEFKAIAAAATLNRLAISVPGVGTVGLAAPVLKFRAIRTVLLAFDADQWENKDVARATLRAAEILREDGLIVKLLQWWDGPPTTQTPKGLDDAQRAGGEVRELAGDQVDAYLVELAAEHGLRAPQVVAPLEETEPHLDTLHGDGRPTVVLKPKDLYTSKRRLAQALGEMEMPTFLERDNALVVVRNHQLVIPSVSHLRSELVEHFKFVTLKMVGDDWKEQDLIPPQPLLEALRDTPGHFNAPSLRDFTVAPVVLPDGTITREPGYYPEHQAYFSGQIPCGDVPERPTKAEVEGAVKLLHKPIADFPFVSDDDRANVIALMLAIVGRPVITGLTPAHMLGANTPGTGKGLLAEVISLITTGRAMEATPWKSDGEEFRKSVTTSLMEGARMVCYDNVNDAMDSGNFAAVVTCRRWNDRQLGSNTPVKLENRTIFLATANNPTMSAEVQRRFVTAELATALENPADRGGFAIENLPEWVADHQVELLAALLTLWRAWFAAGKPLWRERKLGSFEEYSQVIGGVLAVAGIKGFLANKERVRADADNETSDWRSFVGEWWRQYRDKHVTATQLQAVCIFEEPGELSSRRDEPLLLSVLGSGNERSQQSRLGHGLKGMRNRVFGLFQIRKSEKPSANTLYHLEPTGPNFKSGSGSPQSPIVLQEDSEAHRYAENDSWTYPWTSKESPIKSNGSSDALAAQLELEEREERRALLNAEDIPL